jgi:hypothetical protein
MGQRNILRALETCKSRARGRRARIAFGQIFQVCDRWKEPRDVPVIACVCHEIGIKILRVPRQSGLPM